MKFAGNESRNLRKRPHIKCEDYRTGSIETLRAKTQVVITMFLYNFTTHFILFPFQSIKPEP